MQKRNENRFFQFTRKEKNGTIVLLLIIILLLAIPILFPLLYREQPFDPVALKYGSEQLQLSSPDSVKKQKVFYNNTAFHKESKQHYEKNLPVQLSLFYFDPNTLDDEGWKRLGLREKAVATIQRYVSKGGRIKVADDIRKIWGLHEDEIAQLLPYIKIETQVVDNTASRTPVKNTVDPANHVIDINEADSTAFISLPGIGPGYAKRIIKFRDKLGGFIQVNQVAETFGLPDSTFQKIKSHLKISNATVRKINVNTATLEALKEHPYIRYQTANAIIQYRTQHGLFTATTDLKKIQLVTDELYEKIAPYINIQ